MKKMFKKYGISGQQSRGKHSPFPYSPRHQMNIFIEKQISEDAPLSARITIKHDLD